ncbi:hypothetical protein Tco_0993201 [Tanacetum coccineum]|uniref:Uncharacterized protein n=1 Tax=Tanacetum coccineum TaxID=301880 RepID=A0ABQ5F6F5_9ASTR
MTLSDDPEMDSVPRYKTYHAESDQKDKMRHAMDDNGIPSKEIHERHRERADLLGEHQDDTKPLHTFQNLKRTHDRGPEPALITKMLTPPEWRNLQNTTIFNLKPRSPPPRSIALISINSFCRDLASFNFYSSLATAIFSLVISLSSDLINTFTLLQS